MPPSGATGTPYEWFERAGGREALAERLTWRGLGRRTIAGALGGVFAGAAMMAVVAARDALADRDPGHLAKLIAATFGGAGALVGGAGTVAAGLGLHAFTSAAWGIVYAFCISRRVRLRAAWIACAAHTLLVWSTMTWTVLPWADPTLYARVLLFEGPWFFAHVVYGVASVAILPLLAWLPLRPASRVPGT